MSAVLTKGLLALVPVLLYLGVLVVMDSYKLVRVRSIIGAILFGGAVVPLCRLVNIGILETAGTGVEVFVRYVAPVVEEVAKAAFLYRLIRLGRTGFVVDAAILGFAVGTGFALVENVIYLIELPTAGPITWLLRGCGTALMHGCTTGLFGIISQLRADRTPGSRWRAFVPGLLLAIAIHSVYNHFLISPAIAAAGLAIGVPIVAVVAFRRSEQVLEEWLQLGFDTDAEMLEAFQSGTFAETRVGAYLLTLRKHFPPAVVVDMFCLLQLQVELSIRAKGLLLMRQQGYEPGATDDVEEKLVEMASLRRSIGRTGRRALGPFLRRGRRDLWEGGLLEK